MESLIKEMQDPETGVPVRSQKLFLTYIPCAFMGKIMSLISILVNYSHTAISRRQNNLRS